MSIDDEALYRLIGARVRARRLELEMTQDELGEAIGMLRTSIANLESGRQRAPVHVLYNICAVLRMETSALFPSLQYVSPQRTVQVQVDGGVKEVSPETAELLRRLLEE